MDDRKELLDVLMDVINQACQVRFENETCYIHHSFLGAYERAFKVLEEEGLMKECSKGEYMLLWYKTEKKGEAEACQGTGRT